MFLTLLVFLVLLSVLVLVHELGHFIAAKKTGIEVEEFGWGLPPRIFGRKIGETIYSINLLPIGGFVKLAGEDEEREKGDERSFQNKQSRIKAAVLLAGVLGNYFLGMALLGVGFAKLGVPKIEVKIQIEEVVAASPAEAAGLKKGDQIILFDGAPIKNGEWFINEVRKKIGSEVVLLTERERESKKQEFEVRLVPRVKPPVGQGALGIKFVSLHNVSYQKIGLLKVPLKAFSESLRLLSLMVESLTRIVKDLILAGILPKDIAGPVGIAVLTGEVAKEGFWQLLNFAALLSINLALLNLLPLPALDGGRLLVVLLEGALRRRINPHWQKAWHTAGLILLLLLMLLVTVYDVVRIF